eukprot:TRINITY_DN3872_c0_g1_i1.p2 TRINITY_DN3872_c0_g1~~TRINITY_DN3872_c0_g1_i1.p2  ORF type:complete len:184 (+),score=14.84 TRINITY_DN3872_c0_g1_i1:157-708(+)
MFCSYTSLTSRQPGVVSGRYQLVKDVGVIGYKPQRRPAHLMIKYVQEQETTTSVPIEPELESESQRKKREADELRAQEQFMVVGKGEAECVNCQYAYKPSQGDPEFPIAKGTMFEDLPEEWQCPGCGSPKSTFKITRKVVAGFAANQGYGFGTNSWTGDQKLLVIYGALLVFFFIFISGYLLD